MGFLAKVFGKSPAVTLEHPVFGTLVLEHGAKGSYWMHEVLQGEDGISIDTRETAEPTPEQVEFFQQITSDLDRALQPALPEIARRHKELHRKDLPSDWRQPFKLAGVGVPLNGDANSEWDVTLECLTDNSQFLYTCYFEGGKLAHVSVDT